ncbi:outer membrane beta-barrel protein [Chitinophaga sp. HK235]|uniref:outer membrane beta-barrel protein n=1 Tax=Chitinophaga sp. HK235 TaxID=2952571 RepID=UPI001BA5D8CF|nr:outer membrane beta-barrel protein [Chitinophaga sp. HK235]
MKYILCALLLATDMATAQDTSRTKQQLKEVSIQGWRPLVERKSDKTIVQIENTIAAAGASLLEVMEKLPGVQVGQGGQLSVNGRPGMTILIDGKNVALTAEDLQNLLRSMPASQVRKIEIITHPGAAYDAAGNGGIINIIRKTNRQENLNGSISAGYGQAWYPKYNTSINLGYKNQSYNLTFDLGAQHTTNFYTTAINTDILYPDHRLMSRQQTYNRLRRQGNNLSPALSADIYLSPRATLSFSAMGSYLQSRSRVQSLLWSDADSLVTGNQVESKPYHYITGLQWQQQLDSNGQQLTVAADYSIYNSSSHQYASINDEHLTQERKLHIYAVKADYTLPLAHQTTVTAGFKYSSVAISNNNSYQRPDTLHPDIISNSETITAGYLQFSKNYTAVKLQAGIRTEYTQNHSEQHPAGILLNSRYLQLFPSFFITYNFHPQHTLQLKCNSRTDRPSYTQLNPFRYPLSPKLYFTGNPQLQPQMAYNAALTYGWRQTLFITAGYDFYRHYIATLPFLDDNQKTITRTPVNIQRSGAWNLNISYNTQWTSWWSADYDVTFFSQSFSGDMPYRRGLISWNINCNQQFRLTPHLQAECQIRAVSGQRVVSTTTTGYYMVHAGIRQQLFRNTGSIAVRFTNLLQSEDEASYYDYERLRQDWYIRFFSRGVQVNFSYRFGKGKAASKSSSPSEEQRRAG